MGRNNYNHDSASTWNITNRGSQKYDAWLHWIVTEKCNLRCAFCSGEKVVERILKTAEPEGASTWLTIFRYALERVICRSRGGTINVSSLLESLDRTGRIFRIGFVGGEPFLVSNFVEACEAVTQKHYISLNTNLTSPRLRDFCSRIDPLRVVHFHASAHIEELERKGLLGRYIDNFLMCRDGGFNIFAREVAYPPFLSQIERYKKIFSDKGIRVTFGPFFGVYQGRRYPQAYSAEEIKAFGLEGTSDSDIAHMFQRGKLCNAGYNAALVDQFGIIRPCFSLHHILGNIYGEIRFRKDLVRCPFEVCTCPFKGYDQYLFDRALHERGCLEQGPR